MSGSPQMRYEVLRTLRNGRALAASLALPLVVFYAVAPGNRHATADGVSFPLYFMTGMAAYGAMFAVVGRGAGIAVERSKGWTRQIRLTPLRPRTYFLSKAVAAYLVALLSLGLMFLAGTSLGVRLDATQWLEMTGLLLIGLVPFAVMGLIIGHLLTADALVPGVGGVVIVFALFGGVFGQLFKSGMMLSTVKLLPSYWLVQAGKSVLGAGSWPSEGWIVVAVWTVVLVPLSVLVYRRDTGRV